MMMRFKAILFVSLFVMSVVSYAQKSNDLINRDFWKEKPSLDVVKKKVAEGHNPTVFDEYQFDATTLAINAEVSNAVILYLMSFPENHANKITHDGRTYMFWATWKGNLEVMDYLVKKGTNLKHIDEKGSSILVFATMNGQKNQKVIDYLLKNGADINEKSKGGASVLQLVSPYLSSLKEAKYFTDKGLKLNVTDDLGYNTFAYATKGGNISFLEELIKEGIDPKAETKDGGNAFLFAVQGTRSHQNKIEVFHFLEKLGLNPTVSTEKGKNPLHYLARSKDGEVIDYFISKGVSVNQADEDGNTPLMFAAARQKDVDLFNKFFNQGKNWNAKNKEGQTALTFAIMNNSTQICLLLIGAGGSGNLKDKEGNNLSYYLIKSYKDKLEYEEKLRMLYTFGFSNNHTQGNGNTLYHIAVKYRKAEVIKYISEDKSINVNKLNKDGLSPLHLAASMDEDGSLLKLLITLGADKTIKTEFGETAYDLAKENELLIKNKIDIEFLR